MITLVFLSSSSSPVFSLSVIYKLFLKELTSKSPGTLLSSFCPLSFISISPSALTTNLIPLIFWNPSGAVFSFRIYDPTSSCILFSISFSLVNVFNTLSESFAFEISNTAPAIWAPSPSFCIIISFSSFLLSLGISITEPSGLTRLPLNKFWYSLLWSPLNVPLLIYKSRVDCSGGVYPSGTS